MHLRVNFIHAFELPSITHHHDNVRKRTRAAKLEKNLSTLGSFAAKKETTTLKLVLQFKWIDIEI